MKSIEAADIFSRLNGLWPDWQPTSDEKREWMQSLVKIPQINTAEEGLSIYYAELGKWKRPALPDYLNAARRVWKEEQLAKRCKRGVRVSFYLQKEGINAYKKPLIFSETDDPDFVKAMAEKAKKKHEEYYGGHWILVQADENYESEWTKQLRSIDGVTAETDIPRPMTTERKALLDEAISLGPDCPGKQFVLDFNARHAKPENHQTTIGDAVFDFAKKYNLME